VAESHHVRISTFSSCSSAILPNEGNLELGGNPECTGIVVGRQETKANQFVRL
jgi:hypothetical protein